MTGEKRDLGAAQIPACIASGMCSPSQHTNAPSCVDAFDTSAIKAPNKGNAQGWESSHSGPGRGQVLVGGDGPEGRSLLPDHGGKAVGPLAAERPNRAVCSRCGGTDSVRPLPKRFACKACGPRGLCYACDVSHNGWCGQ